MMVILLALISLVQSFEFREVAVFSDTTVIGQTAQYTFLFERFHNNVFAQTAWRTQQVSSTATMTIQFPSQYSLSTPTCVSVTINSITIAGFSCSVTANTITLNNVFSSVANLSVYDGELVIGNVINPTPAVYTSQFIGTIGGDVGQPAGGGIQLTAATFDSCSVTFDPAIVNQTSKMIITIDPKNQLTTTSYVRVTLPSTRQWLNDISNSQLPLLSSMTCTSQSADISNSLLCGGDLATFAITATNLFTGNVVGSVSFGVSNFQSPPTLQPSDLISIKSYQDGNQVDKCSVYPSGLIPNTFNSLTISPIGGTMVVNTRVGLQFILVLADFVNQVDQFQITFPQGLTISYANVTGTGSFDTGSVTGQVLTITQKSFVIRTYTQGSNFIINFYNFTAPPSTKPTDGIEVTINRNGYAKMTGTATVQADPSTLSGSAAATVTTVWANTTYEINITTLDALSSSGTIKIIFPSTIVPTKTTNCATLTGTNVIASPTCVVNSGQNSLVISSMNSSTADISIQTIEVRVEGVVNAPSTSPSGAFTVETYYTSDTNSLVAQGTISGVTATVGAISSGTVEVVPSSYVVLDTGVTYTLSFVNTYEIPIGGFIQITIPDGITLDLTDIASYCKYGVNGGAFAGTNCVGSTQSTQYLVRFGQIAQSGAIGAGTNISLRIETRFTNPTNTRVVSSFSITTYSSDSFSIERLASGISVQMTTPSTMVTATVQRNSNMNSALASYTIRLTQRPPMQASSNLYVTFPPEMELTPSTTCTDLFAAVLVCSHSSNVLSVGLGSSSIVGLAEFGVIVSNVINPPSYKPISGFNFLTKTSSQLDSYASKTSTDTLSNSEPSSFSVVSSQYSNRVYGEASNLQITLTPSSRIIPAKVVISLASSFAVTTLTCTSFVGFSASCTSPASHNVDVTGTLTATSMTFTIAGFTTPLTVPSDYTVLNSYDPEGYQIDQSLSDVLFSVECTMPCKACSANTTQCQSCYSNTGITTFIYYYDVGNSCEEICPPSTYDSVSLLRCLSCDGLCEQCSTTSTNCTSCHSNSTHPYLNKTGFDGTCLAGCPLQYYADTNQLPILCVSCVSPCRSCTDAVSCLSCVDGFYYYLGNCEGSCPAGTTVPNNATNQCDSCDSQCAQCSGTVDNCTSCAADAALHNGACVTTCPPPLVINNGQCSSCDNSCETCDTVHTNCTGCVSNSSLPLLHQNTCFGTCPQFYYEDRANGVCLDCSTLNIGCVDCLSSSTCDSCDADYVFLNNVCHATTPVGYVNVSGIAEACTGDCLTCEGLTSNCTACKTKNLDGNDCVDSCPAGEVPVNRVCTPCTSPCKTCSNTQTNCTSCQSNLSPQVFLSNNDCVQNCPDFFYENFSNNECTSCVSPCERCQSQFQCASCVAGYFLLNNTCDTTCPFGYLGLSRICESCTSPCQSCENSVTTCLTCVSGYYYVATTKECVVSCPVGLYPNPITNQCGGCTSPCNTCTNTSTTCLSCLSGFLLNSDCVANCSDNYYVLNGECIACNVGCQTCSSASMCLTCTVGYYFYNNFCLGSCPSVSPVIDSSGRCQPCSDANCIVCDSLDQCTSCNYPSLLHFGKCLDSCPTDYSANGTQCYYNPQTTTNTTVTNETTAAEETLNQTLTSSDYFPVPFSIGGTFVGVACLMSKFQNHNTFLSGALFSLWAIMEMGSLTIVTYLYVVANTATVVSYAKVGATASTLSFSTQYLQALIFGGAICFMYLLNVIALFAQNCYLRGDRQFNKWLNTTASVVCYYVLSIFGVLLTHKVKNLMFSKLFNFYVFKAQLDSVQQFRIFHIFSFLSFIPSIAILYAVIKLLIGHVNTSTGAIIVDQLLMAYIDVILVVLICMILALISTCKTQNYFQEKYEDGYILNKRIVDRDQILHEAVIPMMQEDDQSYRKVGKAAFNNHVQSSRRFRSYEETQSQTSIKLCNISIQAAPMLHDFSNVDDFYDDRQLSNLSMFKKVDRSVNVSHHQKQVQEVSIQHQPNIFERQSASIQIDVHREQASIQNDISKADQSLQHAPIQKDQEIQMEKEEKEHSIQCVPIKNDTSVQYSAKPIYDNRSQEVLESGEEDIAQSKQLYEDGREGPIKEGQQLHEELQLDIDQKLEREKVMRRQLKQEQIQKQKQQTIQRFQREREEKEREIQRKVSQEKMQETSQRQEKNKQINQFFNNDESRRDGSSLMDSDANIMVRFGKKQEQKERAPSAKTQKQILDLLENKDQNYLSPNESLSFNVTKDLEAIDQENESKLKQIIYQEQDKIMDSEEDGENQERSPRRENPLLRVQTQEEMPSLAEKSRSTNINSRRPPLPYNSREQNNLFIDTSKEMEQSLAEEEQIIHKPFESKFNFSRYKAEQNLKDDGLDPETKTNLNNFYQRKNRNSISAQYLKKRVQTEEAMEDSEKKSSQQSPLPLPKIQKLKSQESNDSNDDKIYKINSKKLLLEGKRLDIEFMEDDKIEVEEQEEQPQRQLPRVWKSQSKLKPAFSKTKPDEKPIHRQILGGGVYNRTQRYLEKEQKKAENTKKKIQEIEGLLQRPAASTRKRGYMQQTYTSEEKKKKTQVERVYKNNPVNRRQLN